MKKYLKETKLQIYDEMEQNPDIAALLDDRTLWMMKLYVFVDYEERQSDVFLWYAFKHNIPALVCTILKGHSENKTEEVSRLLIPNFCKIKKGVVQKLDDVTLEEDPYDDDVKYFETWKCNIKKNKDFKKYSTT